MPFFEFKFGLNASGDQGQILDLLKSNGGSGIQTASGIFAHLAKSKSDLVALLGDLAEGVSISEGIPDQMTPDMEAFTHTKTD